MSLRGKDERDSKEIKEELRNKPSPNENYLNLSENTKVNKTLQMPLLSFPKTTNYKETEEWKLSEISGFNKINNDFNYNHSSKEKKISSPEKNSSYQSISSTPPPDPEFLSQDSAGFSSSVQNSAKNFLNKRFTQNQPSNAEFQADVQKRLIQYLHRHWLQQNMCDVVVVLEDGDLLTHQTILAIHSPTLESLFENNKKPLPQFVQINLSDQSRENMADILNYLYTANLKIDCKNIANYIAIARQLDFPEIINFCGIYLTKNYNHDNIFLHFSVAANNNLKNSKSYLLKVIALNFNVLSHHSHFLYIPFERLSELLTHESLAGQELEILMALIKWIDFNRAERLSFSRQLFSHIRFELIDPETIANQIEVHDWLFSDKGNMNLLSEAYKYHALIGSMENCKQNFETKTTKKILNPFKSFSRSQHLSPQTKFLPTSKGLLNKNHSS